MREELLRDGRRIAAIVLPRLLVELAVERRANVPASTDRAAPIAVLLDDPTTTTRESALVLAAVDERARQAGVRAGQTLAEASGFSARLDVVHLDVAKVRTTLTAIAEAALSFGPTVSVSEASFDTVWVDVTGTAHLFGGEEAIRVEIEERLRTIGWSADVAIADGPRVARALARHPGVSVAIAKRGEGGAALAPLPIKAILDDDALLTLFVRLGVLSVDDFVKLPRHEVTSRLGARAASVLALARGDDTQPLEPYAPPDVLVEEVSFEDGIELTEPILFVCRGMASRLSARLTGRAQATNHIEILLRFDAGIHRLRAGATRDGEDEAPLLQMAIDLPTPLSNEAMLFRTIKAKIADIVLPAPVVSVALTLTRITGAPRVQLDLSRDVSVNPDALPALAAELAADIGEENVGVLSVVDSHRPEAESLLRVYSEKGAKAVAAADTASPTRLFSTPIPVGSIAKGAAVFLGHDAFEVAAVHFHRRLAGVEWWTEAPVARDYFNVALVARTKGEGKASSTLAWVYVDRQGGETFVHGLWE